MELLNINDKYILFDKETFSIYRIDPKTANKLNDLNMEERDQIYGQIKEKDTIPVCESPISDKNKEKCCNRLIIIACQDCNLMCRYCYAQQGSYGENNIKKNMSLETYKKSFDFILSEFPGGIRQIQFFGGEPLLNFKFIKEACEWTTDFCSKNNIKIPDFSIVTNGTIISDEIIDMFHQYHFFVTISLDGNKEVNDLNRIYKHSNSSVFDKIEENINYINEKRNFYLSFEMTVDKANILQFKRNKKLLDIEKIMCFNPDVIHILPAQWGISNHDGMEAVNENIDKNDFIEYFDSISDTFFDKTIQNKTQLTSTYNILNKVMNKTRKKNFCGAGITDFSISAEGDIYPCFMFTGIERFKIGNVMTYENSNNLKEIQKLFENTSFDHVEKCSNCWASGLCHSCIGFNYFETGELSIPTDSICTCQKTLIKRTLVNLCDYYYKNLQSS